MVGGNVLVSLGILLVSLTVLLYAVLAFAHVRITDADMTELERLRSEGLLPQDAQLIRDFRLVRRQLGEIAPAVCLRQEFWLQLYFQLLRIMRWTNHIANHQQRGIFDRELLRLSAYQAAHFRVALARIEAIRNPVL